jgi:hypothetical protein
MSPLPAVRHDRRHHHFHTDSESHLKVHHIEVSNGRNAEQLFGNRHHITRDRTNIETESSATFPTPSLFDVFECHHRRLIHSVKHTLSSPLSLSYQSMPKQVLLYLAMLWQATFAIALPEDPVQLDAWRFSSYGVAMIGLTSTTFIPIIKFAIELRGPKHRFGLSIFIALLALIAQSASDDVHSHCEARIIPGLL